MEQIQELFSNFYTKTLTGTNDSDQHLMTLFSMILQTKATKVLELGVRDGYTTEPMLAGTVLNGGHITCLDIEPSRWPCPTHLQKHYTFVQSDAIKFLEEEVKKGSYYDFVYVDDWHSAPHVAKELELIEKLTDKKSLILLHDLMGYNSQPEYFYPVHFLDGEWAEGGPYGAVKELPLDRWEWATIPVNNGLTILRQK